ncbi:MAG: endonuclease/exonuclease/phosphatase family protein [Candidatus Delongbacteria bacterium]|nr:endonuclease/exonuclease/phosphatase family protein [Candidatus Delongbacteria bacterium]
MKILFWNIGNVLSERKIELITESISIEHPDIFCIAEGSYSRIDCQRIVDKLIEQEYICYYSPLFCDKDELQLNYKYVSNGLKIFIKVNINPIESFSFSSQRKDGRIVALKTFINYRATTLIFLHNTSKSGNREVTDDQRDFISSLGTMIDFANIGIDTERIIIIGDFNLEPWDNILRHKKYIESSFFYKQNSLYQRKNNSSRFYFNPSPEIIFQSKIENLGGTFYTDNSGWALFDYVLYNTKDSVVIYDVITEFAGGSKLLNYDNSIRSSFINDDLDHLPIITKINN